MSDIIQNRRVSKKVLLEYVWIDADDNTRSKTKIVDRSIFNKFDIAVNQIPEWNFDGSSTGQATGKESDILLYPRALYHNPFINYTESYLVLCDCWNRDRTPHITNHRVKLLETAERVKEHEPLFGIEQEYVIFERKKTLYAFNSYAKLENLPYKWSKHGEPGMGPQGPYYCSVGGGVCFGRQISDKHLEYCLSAGLSICGTNAEVMGSQWEYQIGPLGPVEVSDQLWISRYILNKISEEFDCVISFHPKPYKGDWNGSGGHTNFSTKSMRGTNGMQHIIEGCEKLGLKHKEHMEVYGKYNEERLTGNHETSSMDDFSWGISHRGKSIRIPLNVAQEGYGYLEDRRPSANLNPYLVCEKMCDTICS